MIKNLLTYIFATTITLISLSSCGKREPNFVIGVSQCSDDIWRSKMNDELRIAAFARDDIKLKIVSANDNMERQIRQIDSLVEMGTNLLIVAPIDGKVTQAIDRAYKKGIPVIVFDRRSKSNEYTAYIGADNKEIGRNIAKFLSTQIEGNGNILEIGGLRSSSPAVDRRNGFDNEAGRHKNMKIVGYLDADWTMACAYRLMDSLLSGAHPRIDYVFAHNDRMARGAIEAARKHHIDLKKIKFIGTDAVAKDSGGLQMVKNGELLASYIYPTRGDKVMELAINILEKKPFKRENQLSSALVTSDNANVLLMQNDEMKRHTDDLLSLRHRVETTTNAFDTQRNYLFMLLLLVVLLVIVCAFAMKAFIAKTRYNRQLKQSMLKQKKMTEDMELMTQNQLRFFTNISHELRTPLTLISGPADQLAEHSSIDSKAQRLVEMIRRNAGILTQMVNEILEFRKIQNDKAKLSLNRFNLDTELSTWSNDFNTVAERKHIVLKVCVKSEGCCTVIADKEKIAHVYFNLMTNAIKYTQEHGTVTTLLEHANDKYTVSVTDTGKGMKKEDRQHIFERFYQAKDSVGGTGIGLAIVKAYVDLHHGDVGVESDWGKGSRFYFTIPEEQPGYDADSDIPTKTKVEPKFADDYSVKDIIAKQNTNVITDTEDYDCNRPLILVIDDNESMRTYLKGILQAKYNVLEAQNGEEGLKMARKTVPQLVVSDVMMPVMDGLEFCRQMKDNISTSHIPIILLTAKSLEEQRIEGYKKGADSYITKPFTADTLIARIENLLTNRHQLRKIFTGSLQENEEQEDMNEKDQTFIIQLRRAIKKHIPDAEYSVEDLGEEMGLSRVQLYRKVKAMTGYSVVDLLRKARLAKAKQLLETTDKNISEVAYDVGFATPSYFAKRFKEEYGISPGDIEK